MKLKTLILTIAVLTIMVTPCLQAGSTFFSNPYSENSEIAIHSRYSSNPHYENRWHNFADFYWGGDFEITDFHWWGVPIDTGAEYSNWLFQIYDQDPNGHPGNLLYEESVFNNAHATFVDHNDQFGPNDVGASDVYSYWFDLATPFAPSEAGTLWFSIYAVSDHDWSWAMSDGDPYQQDWLLYQFDNGHYWTHVPGYREGDFDGFAFELSGDPSTVPEPTTLALFGFGLIGMAMRRKRRK